MPETLRGRIFLSFSLFAVCMGGLLLLFVWMSYEAGQESASQKLLESEARTYLADPTQPLPRSDILKGYIGIEDMPALYRDNLTKFEAEDYQVPIMEWREIQLWQSDLPEGGGTFYLFLDLRETADQEILGPNAIRALLAGGAAGMLLLLAVSAGVSKRLTTPLNALVKEVDSLQPDQSDQPLAARHPEGETARLAQAFDRLQHRIHTFVEREKRFTRNASHELRTPITLMQSAAENLRRTLPHPEPVQARALEHLQWGTRDMRLSIETFLALAREEDSSAAIPFHGWEDLLQNCVDSQKLHRRNSTVAIHTELTHDPGEDLPPHMIRAVINNLLRNALQHTEKGEVRILLDAETLMVSDTGPGIPDTLLDEATGLPVRKGPDSHGEGLGLQIVQEICARYGWKLDLVTNTSGSRFTVFLQK